MGGLNECPVCGAKARVWNYGEYRGEGASDCYFVVCSDKGCLAHTGIMHTKWNAISEWNAKNILITWYKR